MYSIYFTIGPFGYVTTSDVSSDQLYSFVNPSDSWWIIPGTVGVDD